MVLAVDAPIQASRALSSAGALADHWRDPAGGSFQTGSEWSLGYAPGPGDDAILDASSQSPYVVTAAGAITVNSIQTAATGTLSITGAFTSTNGTGGGVNEGGIDVQNGATLELGGTIVNNGSIEIIGTGAVSTIQLESGDVDLEGGGAVFMDFEGPAGMRIVPSGSGTVLTVDQRISGTGLIGGGSLTIVSLADGFLEAKGGLLTIDTGANTIVNGGLIDAEGAPSYPLTPGDGVVKSPVANSGYVKSDGTGSVMEFQAPVTGGGWGILTGGTLKFNSAFNERVAFDGNGGTLSLAQSAQYTAYIYGFDTGGATALDLGDIAYTGGAQASYAGSSTRGTLTVTDGAHVAHINLSGDFLSLAFQTASDGHGGVLLTLGTKAAHWLRPVNGAFQTASDWSNGQVPGSTQDAVLDASGAAYTVTAAAAETVTGVETAANATLAIESGFTATEASDGGASAGHLDVFSGGGLALGGTMANSGVIVLAATSAAARLTVLQGLTLTGGGEVFLGDKAVDIVSGSASSAVLDNLQGTIAGGGELGAGEMTLINAANGVIELEGAVQLLIDTGANAIVNAGLIEVAGAGATIAGAVSNSGYLKSDGASLLVQGAVSGSGWGIVDGGVLTFASGFNERVAFQGAGGTLALGQSAAYTANIYGFGAGPNEALDLQDIIYTGDPAGVTTTSQGVLLTITGANATARINLVGDFAGLVFATANAGHYGTAVTVSPKAIHWSGPVSGGFANPADWAGGQIPQSVNDAVLDASGAAFTVTSSAFEMVAGLQTAANATLAIASSTFSAGGSDGGISAGRVDVESGGTLALDGVMDNSGVITLAATGAAATLAVGANLTLTGGGEVFLGDSANNLIVGQGKETFLYVTDQTIAGGGALGGGSALVLLNGSQGTIESEDPTTPLTIDTGANAIGNAGLIEAAGAGMVIVSPVQNSGYLKADGATLTVENQVFGAGWGIVGGGALRFLSSFSGNVAFQGPGGTLALAQSVSYSATVYGFATNGSTALDLMDIAYTGGAQASFAGTSQSGVLTVTDGSHTAHIDLVGDYLAARFVTAGDGHGGVSVTAGSADASVRGAAFASLSAALAPSASPVPASDLASAAPRPSLLAPPPA